MSHKTGIGIATNTSANATGSTASTATTAGQNVDYIYDPCADFWATRCYSFGLNRFTFEFGIVALLTVLQLSMVVFIVARCRRDPSFRQAFYAQFVAVTIVDCLRMSMQLFDWLRTALELFWTVEFQSFDLQATLAIGNIPQYAQSMLHLLIAVNRFTAFFAPLSHDSLWSRRVVGGSLAATLMLSILLHVIPYYVPPLLGEDPGGYQWNFMMGTQVQIDELVNAGVCFLLAVAGFALSIATIAKLRNLAKSGQMRETNNRRDTTLLLYSIFMVLVQLLVTAVTVVYVVTAFGLRATMGATREETEIYINQIWYKIFAAIARPLTAYFPPYRLSEIYSLSGAPFLLLISNQVRSAYVEFYFKRSARTTKVTMTPVSSIMSTTSMKPSKGRSTAHK